MNTLNCVLDKMDLDWLPVEKSWRLNEKHYGALQGLNKAETAKVYGAEQVMIWRRSFDVEPEALSNDDVRNPRFDVRYKEVPDLELPASESLKDAIARTMLYWECMIYPILKTVDAIFVLALGISLLGIVKHIKDISVVVIFNLIFPTGLPFFF